MRTLRKAEDWERLEVWMLVMWKSLLRRSEPESMEDIRWVTRGLLSQRPSALQRFEDVCAEESSDGEEESNDGPGWVLQDICTRARSKNPPSEDSPGLSYVPL